MPHFVAELIDVLVWSLLSLCPYLHHVVGVSLDECLCREQTEVYKNELHFTAQANSSVIMFSANKCYYSPTIYCTNTFNVQVS